MQFSISLRHKAIIDTYGSMPYAGFDRGGCQKGQKIFDIMCIISLFVDFK